MQGIVYTARARTLWALTQKLLTYHIYEYHCFGRYPYTMYVYIPLYPWYRSKSRLYPFLSLFIPHIPSIPRIPHIPCIPRIPSKGILPKGGLRDATYIEGPHSPFKGKKIT